jgi:hypothetical protein
MRFTLGHEMQVSVTVCPSKLGTNWIEKGSERKGMHTALRRNRDKNVD